MPTPNKDRLRLWVEDLRTTDATQGRSRLRKGEAFCCLGRACEVFRAATGQGEWDEDEGFVVGGCDEVGVMPGPVAVWFGVEDNPQLLPDGGGEYPVEAADLNDDFLYTFERIADAIERTFNLAPSPWSASCTSTSLRRSHLMTLLLYSGSLFYC